MPLTFVETNTESRAPGKTYDVFHDGTRVGHLLWTGLPGATWNFYGPGLTTTDGLTYGVWRLIAGATFTTYAEAIAAAPSIYEDNAHA